MEGRSRPAGMNLHAARPAPADPSTWKVAPAPRAWTSTQPDRHPSRPWGGHGLPAGERNLREAAPVTGSWFRDVGYRKQRLRWSWMAAARTPPRRRSETAGGTTTQPGWVRRRCATAGGRWWPARARSPPRWHRCWQWPAGPAGHGRV